MQNIESGVSIRLSQAEISSLPSSEQARIDEPQKMHTLSDSESCRLRFQLAALRAHSCQHQYRLFNVGVRERMQKIHWTLPWLQLRAEKGHRLLACDLPASPDGVAIDLCRFRLPPIMSTAYGVKVIRSSGIPRFRIICAVPLDGTMT